MLESVIQEVLGELEYELEAELEGEVGKLTYRWWVSHSPGFGEGYSIVDSLSTGAEDRTPEDALSRQSAVIQMAYKRLKASGARGIIKVERFVRTGSSWSREKADDACAKASLDGPYLRIYNGCWP